MAKTAQNQKAPKGPHEGRRERLQKLLASDAGNRQAIAVVFSGEEADLTNFFPDPNFFYLTGVSSPNAILVLHHTPQKPAEFLLLPAPDPARERWTGKVLNAGGLTEEVEPDAGRKRAMEETGFSSVGLYHQLDDCLLRPLRAAEILYLAMPEDAVKGPIGQVQLYAEAMRRRHPALEIRNVAPLVGRLRRIKDASEVALLRKAIEVTDAAQESLLRHLKPGLMEYEAQALVEYVFRAGGAESLAFPSIIGSGLYSCILHYDKNRRSMAKGDLVVCDIGARMGMYCADVTRTYPISGRFTKRQRGIYDAVLEAQEAAFSAAKPGAYVRDVHKAVTDLFEKKGLSKHYFHGTSHYLGIQAHDVGSYEEPLEAGAVITVEPGLYIASEELGVRLEDDVLITNGGCEILSKAPKDAAEIEKLLTRPHKTVIV